MSCIRSNRQTCFNYFQSRPCFTISPALFVFLEKKEESKKVFLQGMDLETQQKRETARAGLIAAKVLFFPCAGVVVWASCLFMLHGLHEFRGVHDLRAPSVCLRSLGRLSDVL